MTESLIKAARQAGLIPPGRFVPGEIVRVHLYGGATGERRVVKDLGKTVVICTERTWQASIGDERGCSGVGFPRSDVKKIHGH